MLQCCGNNQHELKLSNSYFQFGECLWKCNRIGEALGQYRKVKYVLEVNSYGGRPEYGVLLGKIGRIVLWQGKDGEAYEYFVKAVTIFE